jgi:hypothetical protein
MKCARCSAELPSQSQFCLRCGTPIHATAPNPTSAMTPPAALSTRANNRPLMIAVVVLLLAVLGLGAKLFLSQKAAATGPGQLVQAPGQGASSALVQDPGQANSHPLVQEPGKAQPPDLSQAPTPKEPYPYDIDDYLKFLKDVERRKMELTKQEMASALANYGGLLGKQAEAVNDDDKAKSFLPDINKDSAQFAKKWDDLTRYFRSKEPPATCVPLRDKYYDYLGKVAGMFVKINNALQQAQGANPQDALQAVTSMQGSASAEADAAARLADDAVADICDRYHLKKDFDIKTDPSSFTGLSH